MDSATMSDGFSVFGRRATVKKRKAVEAAENAAADGGLVADPPIAVVKEEEPSLVGYAPSPVGNMVMPLGNMDKDKYRPASGTPLPATNLPETFHELGLGGFLVDSLRQLSIHRPTEIQRACIPPALQGKNVIGSAKTGSGKTAAFALPILQKLAEDPFGVFALVLTPTRELAYQIAEQFKVLGEGVRLRQAVIVGGVDMMQQALELSKRPHVVVATPGRLVDHIRSNTTATYLKHLRFLVLDEADRLLEDTFASDLDEIISRLPQARQTLLFSATMTPSIEQIRNAQTVVYRAHERHDIVAKLDQRYIITPSVVRDAHFIWVLREMCAGKTAIVFVGKCKTCELLRVMLRELELPNTALHSKMSQHERTASLAKFRSGVVPLLLTTDVGSRGLDIPSVQFVLNYDIPLNATDYVHRVGRTARAGRGGQAISFVTEIDVDLILNIEKKVGKKMERTEVPEKELDELLNEVAAAKREASLHLLDIKFGERERIHAMKAEGGASGGASQSAGSAKRIKPSSKKTK